MLSSVSARPLTTPRPHKPRPTPAPTPAPSDPGTPSSGGSNGSSTVQAMIGGNTIFPTAHQMLTSARKSVQLEMYEFENASLTGEQKPVGVPGSAEQQQLMQDLADAAKRGVKVQVILDGSNQKNGTAHNAEMSDFLKAHGVDVLSPIRPTPSTLTTSSCWWWTASPPPHRRHELGRSFASQPRCRRPGHGQASRDLQSQIFEPDWQFSGGTLAHPSAAASGDSLITPLTTGPSPENGGSNTILSTVIDQFNNAKKHAYVEMYTLTSQDVLDAMVAAKNRGVDVKRAARSL